VVGYVIMQVATDAVNAANFSSLVLLGWPCSVCALHTGTRNGPCTRMTHFSGVADLWVSIFIFAGDKDILL
jgi:hypothetical protein